MATPQEYHQILSEIERQVDSLSINSISDAQEGVKKLQDLQSRLWEIRKRIASDKSLVWEKYKKESKGSLGDAIVAAFLSKRTEYKVRKRSRDRLGKERDELLGNYEHMQSVIDKLFEKIKFKTNELRTFSKENRPHYRKPPKKTIQNSNKPHRAISSPQNVQYYDYIKSQEWREKAEEAKARAGNRCEVCNKSRAEVQLDAHHRTYERLGNELPEDITVLCRDCHQLYEDAKRIPAPPAIPQIGFCIRCKTTVKCSPKSPYCYACYKVWKKYKNLTYQEKFCHICGKDNESTMARPACLDCYVEHRHSLEFS